MIGRELHVWHLVRKNSGNVPSNGVYTNCIFQAWNAPSMVIDVFGFSIGGIVLYAPLLNVSTEVDIGVHGQITLQICSQLAGVH